MSLPHRRFCGRQRSMETLEDRRLLANLPSGFTLDSVVSGFSAGVGFDFAPDGRIFVAEKSGVIQVADGGSLTEFVDIRSQVNAAHDRGLLGIAVHPQFPQEPYVYVSYTYDPPGVTDDAGRSRVSRITRFTANANTNYSTAVPNSEFILVGGQSTLANIPQPNTRNPANPACGNLGQFVQDCIPADEISHTIGAVRFGLDGSLLVASGDGGNFTAAQQYNARAIDVDSLAGKLLRIDPMTGEGLSDNPFYDGNPNSNRSKVYSLGLRNPFRFEVDPVSGEPFIGDVGWNAWEEINYGSANFGWPCYEGGNGTNVQQNSYASFAECQAFYASGGAVPAAYAYPHTGGGSSVQVGDVYQGNVYPTAYQDALFFFDFNADRISTITLDAQREPQSVNVFATNVDGIVQVSRGPDTNLYLLDIFGGELFRLRYTAGGNTPPTAVASANQVSSKTFDFSSQGSFDPDADPLQYLWDFGDGATSTDPDPTHTFSGSGPVTVTLTVTDPSNASDSDTVNVIVDNLLPTAQILSPADGAFYQVGDTIALSGSGVDPEDGTLSGADLSWNVRIHHNNHVHLDFFNGSGTSTSFVADDHDDNSYFEICLTVSDLDGGEDIDCIDIFPSEVDYTFDTVPSGLTVNYSGVDFSTPFSVSVPVNSQRSIAAPATQGGMQFGSWSDGGAASHTITISPTNQTLVATYQSDITVRARGDMGDETIDLQIDGTPVASYTLSSVLQDYDYSISAPVTADQIRVAFTNDLYQPPNIDRAAVIDHIVINGTTYESEHPSVFSTGTWDGSCDPGFKSSERLDCGGYLEYDEAASNGTELVVRALGETGAEQVQLKIDGVAVATFSLTTTMQDYSYSHGGVVTGDQVSVEFINDLFNPPIDRNVVVDHIRIDGTVFESEDPSVLSTGTWDGVSCAPGFKLSERLDCGGEFQYADVSTGGSVVSIRARGETADEIVELQINQATVASFALTGAFADYSYVHANTVVASDVRVVFVNDLYAPPIDRSVVVDHLVIDGTVYETEDPSVRSTGTWDSSCDPGFKQSETLHCGGYFEYGQSLPALPAPPQATSRVFWQLTKVERQFAAESIKVRDEAFAQSYEGDWKLKRRVPTLYVP